MRQLPTVRPAGLALCLALGLASMGAPLRAQEAVAPDRVEITGRHYDNAVGTSDAASQGVIRAELLKSRPALRPGEVLEFVPGLIVTQHSGDGKANQYFLRGFNLDHDTDFATRVDGMPVNMPTHAPGQGYSDLNFLIPELVQRIEYRKGPYFASSGDFASAGAADMVYRRAFDAPFAQVSLGQNGYLRGVLGGSGAVAPDVSLLGAVELMANDGPWTVPEQLRKANGVLTASGGTTAQGWQASLMGYSARWNATDQIPQRLIDAGSYQGRPFGRYDTLDASDGGSTSRYSLSGAWHHQTDSSPTRVSAYAMRYRLQLFSNFTYAAERPADGDQFGQQDSRSIVGLDASQAWRHTLLGLAARSEIGLQLRQDRIRVGLFDTRSRQVTAVTRDDDVTEALAGVYAQSAIELTPWLRTVLGLRADSLRARVDSLNLAANSGSAGASLLSPKLSLIAGPFAKTEFFFNAGRGFHSNDARGTTITTDPKTGSPVDKVPGLAASRGMELGARTEAIAGLQFDRAVAAGLRFRAGLRGRCRRDRAQRGQPPPRCGVQQPLGARVLVAGGRRLRLDAGALCQWRLDSQCRGPGGQRGLHGARDRPLERQPAVALPGLWRAGRGQQRALGVVLDHQRAPHAPAGHVGGQGQRADPGRLQPGEPQGRRHPVLLRVPSAR